MGTQGRVERVSVLRCCGAPFIIIFIPPSHPLLSLFLSRSLALSLCLSVSLCVCMCVLVSSFALVYTRFHTTTTWSKVVTDIAPLIVWTLLFVPLAKTNDTRHRAVG